MKLPQGVKDPKHSSGVILRLSTAGAFGRSGGNGKSAKHFNLYGRSALWRYESTASMKTGLYGYSPKRAVYISAQQTCSVQEV